MEEILAENSIWFIIGVAIVLMTIIGYIADKTNFGKKEFSKRKNEKNSKIQKKTIEELEEEAKKIEPKKEEKETILREKIVEPKEEPRFQKDVEKVERRESGNRERVLPREEFPVRNGHVEKEVEMRKKIPSKTPEPVIPKKQEEDLNAPFGDKTFPKYEKEEERQTSRYEREPIEERANSRLEKETIRERQIPKYERGLVEERPFAKYERETIEERTPIKETSSKKYTEEEDLNAPFGDSPILRKNNLDFELPELDSIKQDVNASNIDDDDDDIWKF